MPEISKKRIGDLPSGHDMLMERTNETNMRERRGRGFPSREGAGEEYPDKHREGAGTDIPNVYPEEIPFIRSRETSGYEPIRGSEVLGVTDFGIMDNPCRTISDPAPGDPGPDSAMPERFNAGEPSGEL